MVKRKLEDTPITGALDERRHPDGRRRVKLTMQEKKDLVKQQQIEAAAALFLDLSTYRTWGDIAEELGMSTHKLKELTKTKEFDQVYNALFAELGHDPRYRAAVAGLSDMLPLAVRELKSLLVSESTPPGVRLRTIQQIIALNGIKEQKPRQSDREELAKFLIQADIKIDGNAIPIPQEYADALDADIREIDVEQLPAPEPPQQAKQ